MPERYESTAYTMKAPTPIVNIKSNIVYPSPKEAFKAVSSNKIISREFNKTVEGLRK